MGHLTILSSGLVRPQREPQWADEVPAAFKRRDPRIWQLACVAAHRALHHAQNRPLSLVSGTALGALDETKNFLSALFTSGFGIPRHFMASVHNSMAGRLAIELKIFGPNLTVCDGPHSLASAIVATELLEPDAFPALIVVIDEKNDLVQSMIPHLSQGCSHFLSEAWEEAALALVVDTHPAGQGALIRASVPQPSTDHIGDQMRRLATELAAENDGQCEQALIHITPNPAIDLHECLTNDRKGVHTLGTYSPSARSAAAVQICL